MRLFHQFTDLNGIYYATHLTYTTETVLQYIKYAINAQRYLWNDTFFLVYDWLSIQSSVEGAGFFHLVYTTVFMEHNLPLRHLINKYIYRSLYILFVRHLIEKQQNDFCWKKRYRANQKHMTTSLQANIKTLHVKNAGPDVSLCICSPLPASI